MGRPLPTRRLSSEETVFRVIIVAPLAGYSAGRARFKRRAQVQRGWLALDDDECLGLDRVREWRFTRGHHSIRARGPAEGGYRSRGKAAA